MHQLIDRDVIYQVMPLYLMYLTCAQRYGGKCTIVPLFGHKNVTYRKIELHKPYNWTHHNLHHTMAHRLIYGVWGGTYPVRDGNWTNVKKNSTRFWVLKFVPISFPIGIWPINPCNQLVYCPESGIIPARSQFTKKLSLFKVRNGDFFVTSVWRHSHAQMEIGQCHGVANILPFHIHPGPSIAICPRFRVIWTRIIFAPIFGPNFYILAHISKTVTGTRNIFLPQHPHHIWSILAQKAHLYLVPINWYKHSK